MLLWALYPSNPYGYYLLLRIVVFSIFVYLFYNAYHIQNDKHLWLYGISGIIYNPFLRIHLTRSLWSIVNILTVIIFIYSMVKSHKFD